MINYYLLMKPGIILGNLVTVAAGFLLASRGTFDLPLFIATLLGLAFIIGSACVCNNWIDRSLDSKMKRTKNRPLASGVVSGSNALLFAGTLGLIGIAILFAYTNTLTVCVAAVGFLVYVVLYSLWKPHTLYATAIGSIAGAVPPVVGYCAVSNQFDTGAIIFFTILVLWQMPHFFSIAMYNIEDYKAANIPLLPIVRGIRETKTRMMVYIIAFTVVGPLLSVYHYTGLFYLMVVLSLGVLWLILCLRGFARSDDQKWGRQMFRFSLVVIGFLSLAIPLDMHFLK